MIRVRFTGIPLCRVGPNSRPVYYASVRTRERSGTPVSVGMSVKDVLDSEIVH